jgi:urease accessory protein
MQVFLAVLLPIVAHTLEGGSSAIAGFLHPLLGLDHLLAMVTVGLLSAQIGGKAIWVVPTTFVVAMAIAGVLGYFGVPLPLVEVGITGSVVILGLALLANQKIPMWVAMIFVAIFALFHGHAHGAELPAVEGDILYILAYVLGFMTATAGLHVIGALIGYIALRNQRSAMILRFGGLAIALMGVYLVSQVFTGA